MWSTPQIVTRGQVCDLQTNRCVYEFDCSQDTNCNALADATAVSSISLTTCKKHRDCSVDTTYRNVFTRKDRLEWYVTDQSFGLGFGLSRA